MQWYLLFIAALSLFTFVVYYIDKQAVVRSGRRTPENTLHLLALLGGWPGAFLAQRIFRHKTSKAGFQIIFRLTVCVNISVTVWLWMK
jgi:uncharacterized membrane protein YsdA (DUF1294 family)